PANRGELAGQTAQAPDHSARVPGQPGQKLDDPVDRDPAAEVGRRVGEQDGCELTGGCGGIVQGRTDAQPVLVWGCAAFGPRAHRALLPPVSVKRGCDLRDIPTVRGDGSRTRCSYRTIDRLLHITWSVIHRRP